jgi:hypothetical protein
MSALATPKDFGDQRNNVDATLSKSSGVSWILSTPIIETS